MSTKFIKNQEDFRCEHCGVEVKGNGYTNHCPACLWSKHVDLNPGDRAAACGGLMRPISFEQKGGEIILTHKCELCDYEKPNKLAPNDDLARLSELW